MGTEFMIGSSEQAARSFSIWVHIDLIMVGDRDHRFVGGFAAERYHACEGSCAKSTRCESSQVSGLAFSLRADRDPTTALCSGAFDYDVVNSGTSSLPLGGAR